jgi:hypothetical protein
MRPHRSPDEGLIKFTMRLSTVSDTYLLCIYSVLPLDKRIGIAYVTFTSLYRPIKYRFEDWSMKVAFYLAIHCI